MFELVVGARAKGLDDEEEIRARAASLLLAECLDNIRSIATAMTVSEDG